MCVPLSERLRSVEAVTGRLIGDPARVGNKAMSGPFCGIPDRRRRKRRRTMRYEMMLPHQIRTAIKQRWPVVLPVGVLEYHGEHLAVGLDTLVVAKALEALEKEMDLVILPP